MNHYIEILTHPTDDSFLGWVLLILFWIINLVLVFVVGVGLYVAIDSWFLPESDGTGVITGKHFKPAHYTTTLMYNAATKTNMPVTTWHPDAWKFVIECGGDSDEFQVTDSQYTKYKLGDKLHITYSIGRISKGIYIKSAKL